MIKLPALPFSPLTYWFPAKDSTTVITIRTAGCVSSPNPTGNSSFLLNGLLNCLQLEFHNNRVETVRTKILSGGKLVIE